MSIIIMFIHEIRTNKMAYKRARKTEQNSVERFFFKRNEHAYTLK
jgi:hypothetical protein